MKEDISIVISFHLIEEDLLENPTDSELIEKYYLQWKDIFTRLSPKYPQVKVFPLNNYLLLGDLMKTQAEIIEMLKLDLNSFESSAEDPHDSGRFYDVLRRFSYPEPDRKKDVRIFDDTFTVIFFPDGRIVLRSLHVGYNKIRKFFKNAKHPAFAQFLDVLKAVIYINQHKEGLRYGKDLTDL